VGPTFFEPSEKGSRCSGMHQSRQQKLLLVDTTRSLLLAKRRPVLVRCAFPTGRATRLRDDSEAADRLLLTGQLKQRLLYL